MWHSMAGGQSRRILTVQFLRTYGLLLCPELLRCFQSINISISNCDDRVEIVESDVAYNGMCLIFTCDTNTSTWIYLSDCRQTYIYCLINIGPNRFMAYTAPRNSFDT